MTPQTETQEDVILGIKSYFKEHAEAVGENPRHLCIDERPFDLPEHLKDMSFARIPGCEMGLFLTALAAKNKLGSLPPRQIIDAIEKEFGAPTMHTDDHNVDFIEECAVQGCGHCNLGINKFPNDYILTEEDCDTVLSYVKEQYKNGNHPVVYHGVHDAVAAVVNHSSERTLRETNFEGNTFFLYDAGIHKKLLQRVSAVLKNLYPDVSGEEIEDAVMRAAEVQTNESVKHLITSKGLPVVEVGE